MRKVVIVLLALALVLGCSACSSRDDETLGKGGVDPYLVLVNKDNILPEDWYEQVELVDAKNYHDEEFTVEKEAYGHFVQMKEDLEKDGIVIELDSACRTVDEQISLWERFEKEYGEEYCRKYLAEPGYSEHHTGLAIDIFIVKDGEDIRENDAMIAEKSIFTRIHERLSDYGFILRYPEGKEKITGYSYEPWHFRYVGVKAAREIDYDSITLEEYLGIDEVVSYDD